DERPRNGHHLLLATAQGSRDLVATLTQAGKALQHLANAPIDRSLVSIAEAAELQVVEDGERVPELAAFGPPGAAPAVNLMRLEAQDTAPAAEPDLAGARPRQSEYRLEHCCLAGSVGAEDHSEFAFRDLKRDVAHGGPRAIGDRKVADG